jgi:acylphosphatase
LSRRRVRVLVSGRVQGVWFRGSTCERARDLGLSGWVRNLADGRVEAVFEGEEAVVADALDYVRQGPPGARVAEVEVEDQAPTGEERRFEIARGS